jgi:hypothetical protein
MGGASILLDSFPFVHRPGSNGSTSGGPIRLQRVRWVALAVSPALVAGLSVTVLPKPRFNAPAHAPKASRVHFELVSSQLRRIYGGTGWTGYGPGSFRGAPLLRSMGPLRIYGKDGTTARYVVAPDCYAFDFAKYAWPPRYVRADKEFVYEEVVWAKEAETGVLYVETAHSTYERSSYGLNGYLNAIDLRTKKLVWRSPALVANAENFVLLNEVIVSGYGFTDEPDYLYAISRSTGQVVARLLLPSAPERIVRRGGTLYVRTYDHDLVVRLVT